MAMRFGWEDGRRHRSWRSTVSRGTPVMVEADDDQSALRARDSECISDVAISIEPEGECDSTGGPQATGEGGPVCAS